ncbi:hypothetical protein LU290_01570 [Moraxella nasibovis]|uniref:hypothetical protein n=1 Tax=Moraxella nasibovis TaxID=2904120 RepID=UPI00240EE9F6|nr:hypothetical protein [Moraxella nasibovis]WFF38950.1 hypothetical protein LU290_01570 [Moraxella nasibovis]
MAKSKLIKALKNLQTHLAYTELSLALWAFGTHQHVGLIFIFGDAAALLYRHSPSHQKGAF